MTNAGQVFKPYQSRQGEVGAKYDGGRIGGTLSAFYTSKPVASVDTATAQFEVTEHQINRGAEFSFFGEAARGLRILGGASWLHADVSGSTAIGAPRSQYNLGLDWDVVGLRGVSVDGRIVQTASQYADAANSQRVPSWSRFDLGARWVFDVARQKITLRGRVDNVTSRTQWVSAGGYPGADYLVLGAPRSFVISGSVDF